MLLLLACFILGGTESAPDSADSERHADTGAGDAATPCDVRVVSTVPAQGAIDHYWRDSVQFTLSDADATAVVTGSLPGETTIEGRVVTFTPSTAWSASTTYELEIAGCFGRESLSFTTSAYGKPLTESVEGRVYLLKMSKATVEEPAEIAELLAGYIPGELLMEVVTVSGPNLGLRLGGAPLDAWPPEQSFAVGTVDLLADATEIPYFEVDGDIARVGLLETHVDVSQVEIAGTFASDGSNIGELGVSALVDTRGLAPLFSDDANEGDGCSLLAGLDVACVACPDGEPYCATFRFADVPAEAVEGVSLRSTEPVEGAACSVATGGLSAAIVALGLVARRQRRR